MRIWSQIQETDPDYTKAANVGGNNLTSINGTYAAKKATEAFGPCGQGWGWEIKEDRFDNTKPVMGDDGQIKFWCTQHTVIIDLWYIGDNGERCIIPAAGHTPALEVTNAGKAYYDSDPLKKSITDAVKKALSYLGFSADIFMGLFDDVNYVNELRAEKNAAQIEATAEANVERRREFWGWAKAAVETYKAAKNPAALSVVHTSKMQAAEAKFQLCGENGDKVQSFFVDAYNARLSEITNGREKDNG
jgi:hypothetical protein